MLLAGVLSFGDETVAVLFIEPAVPGAVTLITMLGDTIGVPTVPAGRFAALVQVAVVVPETVAV